MQTNELNTKIYEKIVCFVTEKLSQFKNYLKRYYFCLPHLGT